MNPRAGGAEGFDPGRTRTGVFCAGRRGNLPTFAVFVPARRGDRRTFTVIVLGPVRLRAAVPLDASRERVLGAGWNT